MEKCQMVVEWGRSLRSYKRDVKELRLENQGFLMDIFGQCFVTKDDFALWGHLVLSGDTFDCHDWLHATGI